MDESKENIVSLLTEVKLQSKILVPVLQELRKEIGNEKADEIIYRALRKYVRENYRKLGEEKSGGPYEKWTKVWDELRPRIGNNVEREYLKNDESGREYNVKRCQFAEYFKAIGEPTLGTILMCDFDYYIAEIGEPIVELSRENTIMEGANQCDFCYRFNK